MKILQLCHKPPFPPVDGGCIAMNAITQGLLQVGIDVKVLALNTFKHPLNIDALPDEYIKQTKIETVFIDTQIKFASAFFNLFSNDSYNVKRFFSKEFEKKITEVLKADKYDIVHLESLFVTPYLNIIRENSHAKIILRAHNAEFEIWEKIGEREQNFFKKKYLKLLAARMRNYEIKLLNKYDGIAAISDDDAEKFRNLGCKIAIESIPLGINISEYDFFVNPKSDPLSSRGRNPKLFFLASMDWLPNCDGLEWFLKNVWKNISAKNPQLKFYVGGKAMPDKFLRMKIPNVEIVGQIPDAKFFFLENDIMIVPLFSGSGIRVKIIEAMALKKVVISTTIGAKGINCEHKKNILIADSPTEFSEMISLIVSDSSLRKTISENAGKFVEENYDNRIITKKLISFYKKLIA